MTGSQKPEKKSKAELEHLVKSNGGKIVQNGSRPGTVCIGDQRTVHVASLCKRRNVDIIRPSWLLDNIRQSEADQGRPSLLLPLEPRHMFFTIAESESRIEGAVDEYGDSFARDTTADELKEMFNSMPAKFEYSFSAKDFKIELQEHGKDLRELPGWMFEGLLLYSDRQLFNDASLTDKDSDFRIKQACDTARFAGANFTNDLREGITHVLVGADGSTTRALRQRTSEFQRLPRLVTIDWIEQSWQEKTLLDEERNFLSERTGFCFLMACDELLTTFVGFAPT